MEGQNIKSLVITKICN